MEGTIGFMGGGGRLDSTWFGGPVLECCPVRDGLLPSDQWINNGEYKTVEHKFPRFWIDLAIDQFLTPS